MTPYLTEHIIDNPTVEQQRVATQVISKSRTKLVALFSIDRDIQSALKEKVDEFNAVVIG
jgi:hypothetical protein